MAIFKVAVGLSFVNTRHCKNRDSNPRLRIYGPACYLYTTKLSQLRFVRLLCVPLFSCIFARESLLREVPEMGLEPMTLRFDQFLFELLFVSLASRDNYWPHTLPTELLWHAREIKTLPLRG